MANFSVSSGITEPYSSNGLGVNAYGSVNQSRQSVTNNTTVVSWSISASLYEKAGYTWGGNDRGDIGTLQMVINGSVVGSFGMALRNGAVNGSGLGSTSGETTIEHNADGTKTISAYIQLVQGGSDMHVSNVSSGSQNIQLSTIPRSSTPSFGNPLTVGNKTTIRTNRASSSFTHTLTYVFGKKSGTVATGIGDSVDWIPPADLLTEIPNSSSGNGTFVLTTFSGQTKIGEKSVGFTLNSTQALGGVIITSLTIHETNPVIYRLLEENGTVRYLSSKELIYEFETQHGASIKEVKLTVGTQTLSGSTTSGSNISVNNIDGNIYTLSVKDSRGYVAYRQIDHSKSWYPYEYPTISGDANRRTPTGKEVDVTIKGTFYNADVGSVSNNITLSGDIDDFVSYSGNTFTLKKEVDIDYKVAKRLTITATDYFGYTARVIIEAPKGVPTFYHGNGIAGVVGKFYVDGNTAMEGNLSISGTADMDELKRGDNCYLRRVAEASYSGSGKYGKFSIGEISAHSFESAKSYDERYFTTSVDEEGYAHIVCQKQMRYFVFLSGYFENASSNAYMSALGITDNGKTTWNYEKVTEFCTIISGLHPAILMPIIRANEEIKWTASSGKTRKIYNVNMQIFAIG